MTEITATKSRGTGGVGADPARAPGSWLRLLAPLAMMAAIFYFSAQTFDGAQLAWWEVLARKLGHVTGYGLLTAAWAWALVGRTRLPLRWAAGLAFGYAISDEYHQTFVDGREGTPLDVVIDSIGIVIAAWIMLRRSRFSPINAGRRHDQPQGERFEGAGGAAKRAYSSRT